MGQAMTDRLTGLSTGNARGALLGAASVAVVAVALVLAATGVASGEVVATLLFLPVFAAGLMVGRTAGYGAAGLATLVYVLLRRSDLSGAGLANAGVLTLARAGAYGVAGHVGALAQMLVGSGSGASRAGAAGRSGAAGSGPRPQAVAWDEPGPARRSSGPARDDRTQPVLVGVGSSRWDASAVDREAGYGDAAMTTSGGWPPDPPHEPATGEHVGAHAAGWGDPEGASAWPDGRNGSAGYDDRGWPPDTRPASDDDWEAVQASWRRQNGLPDDEEPAGPALPRRRGARDDDRRGPQASAAADQWGPSGPGQPGPPADPWGAPGSNGAGRHSDPWGTPPAHSAGPASDPWGTPLGNGAGPASDPWDAPAAHGAGPAADPWGASGSNGAGRHSDPWGTPPAHSAGPETDPWGTPIGPAAPHPDPWAAGGDATQAWDAAPAAPAADNGTGPWSGLTPDAWAGSSTGETRRVWDDPAAAPPIDDPWGPPSGPPSGSVPAAPGWSAPAGGVPGGAHADPYAAAPAPRPGPVNLPAVDPETGLWTAKFLRDRLSSERSRSRRSGRPFSMVLVQVPDGPLAQLPYRRQVTLLRELGYQFVAGGVVDHLVHVPDQAQHWFAVILPDTDRSGAQVLERRLRLGIGGYLSSRGLRLRDLESASLTAPDDDPAMGQIWEALIGPDDGGPDSAGRGY